MGIIIFIVTVLSGIVLFSLTLRMEKRSGTYREHKKKNCFERMAWYTYRRLWAYCSMHPGKHMFLSYLIRASQVDRDLRAITPAARPELLQTDYYVSKIKLFYMLLFLGALVSMGISLGSQREGVIVQGEYIARNAFGEGNIQTEAWVKTEDGSRSEKVSLLVEERAFSDEELEALYEQAVKELDAVMFGQNMRQEEVRSDLNLPDSLEGCPFALKWESSDYSFMNQKGKLQTEEISEEGEVILLTCFFSYREWERMEEIPIMLFPPVLDKEMGFEKELQKELAKADKDSTHEEKYYLPDTVGDEKIYWAEEKKDYGLILFMMIFVVSVLVYWLKDSDLHKQAEKRSNQMMTEYPVLVTRLTMYLSAGMTVKSAWQKIAMDYRKTKSDRQQICYTYEEMLFTCYEMKGGVSEAAAYERFAKRCGLQHYTKLCGLLVQNLKKGNSVLLSDLRTEAGLAQEERRNLARKKGEEAGTKMLVPMMLMLGIVMVLIMIPAFLSFAM